VARDAALGDLPQQEGRLVEAPVRVLDAHVPRVARHRARQEVHLPLALGRVLLEERGVLRQRVERRGDLGPACGVSEPRAVHAGGQGHAESLEDLAHDAARPLVLRGVLPVTCVAAGGERRTRERRDPPPARHAHPLR
jgi:hypothetical protein